MPNQALFGRRKDANHNEIKAAIAKCGHYIFDTFRVGQGFPDLLVILRGTTQVVLVEVKITGGKLTEPEKKFHKEYPGTVIIVDSPENAVFELEKLL